MYDFDLCIVYLDILTRGVFMVIILFCGFHRELVYCYYLDSTRIACMLHMHESLGGAFPKRHRANCGMIAIIRKVPILGRHTSNLAMVGGRERIDSASSDLPLRHDLVERMKKTRRFSLDTP
jgi:hypothetical protein